MRRMTPQQLRRATEAMQAELEREQKALLREALHRARGLSTGRYSSEQLRQMGHPYRVGGQPPGDPSVVNRQSGRFARAWRLQGNAITNSAPEARFLFSGTRRMIRRPLMDRVQAFLRGVSPQRVGQALARAFQK